MVEGGDGYGDDENDIRHNTHPPHPPSLKTYPLVLVVVDLLLLALYVLLVLVPSVLVLGEVVQAVGEQFQVLLQYRVGNDVEAVVIVGHRRRCGGGLLLQLVEERGHEVRVVHDDRHLLQDILVREPGQLDATDRRGGGCG